MSKQPDRDARQESKHGWSLTSVWKSLKGETGVAEGSGIGKVVAAGGAPKVQLEDMLLGIWSSTALTVLFVTHDIDEAIYLSDRVLVLGSRPGRVIADIPIDLPRPRDQIESKENSRFSELRRQLFRLIITPAVENAT